MSYNRHSIRLNGFDYSKGIFFVTIDVQDKLKLFWNNLKINKVGKMVEYWWNELPNHFKNVAIDRYVVMPDHFHGILMVGDKFKISNKKGRCCLPLESKKGGHIGPPVQVPVQVQEDKYILNNNLIVGVDWCVDPMNKRIIKLGEVIRWFKTMTTNDYLKNIKNNNWPQFNKRLWQRNYYEKIVRNDDQLNRIRKYIEENPKKLRV